MKAEQNPIVESQRMPKIAGKQYLRTGEKEFTYTFQWVHATVDTSISDLQLPEQRDDKFWLFRATQFVLLCFGTPRKLTYKFFTTFVKFVCIRFILFYVIQSGIVLLILFLDYMLQCMKIQFILSIDLIYCYF